MNALGTPDAAGELALEWTYRAQIMPWLALQPDPQHVMNPGTLREIQNATIFGARIEVGF